MSLSGSSSPSQYTLYDVLHNDYLALLQAIRKNDLQSLKDAFQNLKAKEITWQDLDHSINEEDPELIFSAHLLQECAIFGNVEIFEYLTKEQNIPLDGRCVLAFFAAIDCGNEALVEHFLASPIINQIPLLNQSFLRAKHHNHTTISDKILSVIAKEINLPAVIAKAILIPSLPACSQEWNLGKLAIMQSEKIRLEKAQALVVTINDAGEEFSDLLVEGHELVRLSNEAIDILQHSPLLQNEVLKFYSQVLFWKLTDKLDTLDQENENWQPLYNMIEGLAPLWTPRFAVAVLDELKNELSYQFLLEHNELLEQLICEDLQNLNNLIKDGDLQGVKDLFAAWKAKGITKDSLDQLFIGALRELGESYFTTTLIGTIASHGNVGIFKSLLAENIIPQNVEVKQHALKQAVIFVRDDMVSYLLEDPKMKENISFIFEVLGIAHERGNPRIIASLEAVIHAFGNREAENAIVAMKGLFTQNMRSVATTVNNGLILHFQEIKKLTIALQNTLLKIEGIPGIKENSEHLVALADLKCRDTAQYFHLHIPADNFLAPKMIYVAKNMIAQINEFEENDTLERAKQLLLDIVEALKPTSQLAQVNQTIENNLPDEFKTQILRLDGEDSMDKPNSDEIGFYLEIQKQYKAQFKQRHGTQLILDDLRTYLVAKFTANGLKKERADSPSDEELERYYKNIYHTAWRYIGGSNPWISTKATWAKGDQANIPDKAFEMLAYFWLAASDENTPCSNGIDLEGRKEHFVRELALLNREHNWDQTHEDVLGKEGYFDDLQADNPSCPEGVEKRIFQLLFGHPAVEAVKPLNANIMLQTFKENCITTGLYQRLEQCNAEQLRRLKESLNNWVIMQEDIDPESLNLLEINATAFIANSTEHFGEARLNSANVDCHGEKYANYMQLIVSMAENPAKYFCEILLDKINSILSKKEMVLEEAAPVFLPAFIGTQGVALRDKDVDDPDNGPTPGDQRNPKLHH